MQTVGIRTLKEHASAIIRRVRDEGQAIDVTLRGRVVARIVPVAPRGEEMRNVWAEMDQLAAEIGAVWPTGVSAVDAVSDGRRKL